MPDRLDQFAEGRVEGVGAGLLPASMAETDDDEVMAGDNDDMLTTGPRHV